MEHGSQIGRGGVTLAWVLRSGSFFLLRARLAARNKDPKKNPPRVASKQLIKLDFFLRWNIMMFHLTELKIHRYSSIRGHRNGGPARRSGVGSEPGRLSQPDSPSSRMSARGSWSEVIAPDPVDSLAEPQPRARSTSPAGNKT